jgi:hypothetical protein
MSLFTRRNTAGTKALALAAAPARPEIHGRPSGRDPLLAASAYPGQPVVPTPDKTVPVGVSTEFWPRGWDDPASDYYLFPWHREFYRREAPGSEWERSLLDYFDTWPDPRSIDLEWKEGSVTPRAQRFNKFESDDQPLLRHIGALCVGYAGHLAKIETAASQQRVASWSCDTGCGAWMFEAARHTLPGVPPGARLCPECRAYVAQLAADRLGEDIVAGGRTRHEVAAAWLGVTS